MALPWNKRNVQVQIEEMTKQNVPVFAGDMDLDRNGKGKDLQNSQIQGITFINDFGKNGNFETGISQISARSGYAIMNTLEQTSDSAIGNYAFRGKHTTSTNNSATLFLQSAIIGDVLYASCYSKMETGGTGYFGLWSIGNAQDLETFTDSWQRKTFMITASSIYNYLGFWACTIDKYCYLDGMQIFNLSKMGALPLALQNKYNKINFSQLTKQECDEIFPDYIETAEEFKNIELCNAGKNLFIWQSLNSWVNTSRFQTIIQKEDFFEIEIDGNNSSMTIKNGTYDGSTYSEIFLKPETTYTLSWEGQNFGIVILNQGSLQIIKSSDYGVHSGTFTTDSSGKIKLYAYESTYKDKAIFGKFQIEENISNSDFEKPCKSIIRFPKLNGINGIYDDLDYKRVEHEQITITSNAGTTTSSGTGDCVLINDSTGEIYRGTISGTSVTVTAPDGTYQIFYVLTTPVEQDPNINLLAKYLNGGHNNFIGESYNSDEFSGDGTTTAFTLSTTADDTNYDVLIAGIKQESGVTKTTTNFTFDSAPKNGAIVEVEYNRTTNSSWFATLNVYEPSGTLNTRAYETTISAQSNDRYYEPSDDLGNTEQIEQSSDYTVTLTFDLFENVQSFADEWKGKKFRIIIENISDTATTYTKDIFAVCEILSSSKDYIEGTETVTIKATDYYMNVT